MFVFKHRASTSLPSFQFYGKLVDLSLIGYPSVIPAYYSLLHPYIALMLNKAPSIISMLRQAGLLRFTIGGSSTKKMKYYSDGDTHITIKTIQEFAREIAKDISPYHHYTYEDAVYVLLDLLSEANKMNKDAIALSVLLLYPYDMLADKLLMDNFLDPTNSFIGESSMLLKCTKILFKNSSENNVLTNKAKASLIALIKMENINISSYIVLISEGLLLYDMPNLTESSTLQQVIESFVQSLWKTEDKLHRFILYSGSLYGIMSRYLDLLSGINIGGCLTTLVDRTHQIAKDNIQPQLFKNYVDTVCYILMRVICKLHKVSKYKSNKKLKSIQVVYIQKYCNFCYVEYEQSIIKPKHSMKCHKCKEHNLGLILPSSTLCSICTRSNIYLQAKIFVLNKVPSNGLRCEYLKTNPDTLERILDTIITNALNEFYNFMERNGSVMMSMEYSCHELAENVEFNNNVYGFRRMMEVAELFLKHSKLISKKQVIKSMIVKLYKRVQGFRYD